MSTPMDWQPSKAIQAKTGACEKKLFPDGSKTRKGDPGKNGMMKIKMERSNKKKTNMQKHWPQMRCPKHFTWLFQQEAIPFRPSASTFLQLPAFSDGLDVSSNDCIPRTGTFANICPSASHYVPNIPMFCPSLQNCAYKLPITMHSQAFIHA